jgi:hypothetical protein
VYADQVELGRLARPELYVHFRQDQRAFVSLLEHSGDKQVREDPLVGGSVDQGIQPVLNRWAGGDTAVVLACAAAWTDRVCRGFSHRDERGHAAVRASDFETSFGPPHRT